MQCDTNQARTHAVSWLSPHPHETADAMRRLKAPSSQAAALVSGGGRWMALYPTTGCASGWPPKLNSHFSPAHSALLICSPSLQCCDLLLLMLARRLHMHPENWANTVLSMWQSLVDSWRSNGLTIGQ